MTRPRLLDLFSGAGGAAVGYHRAGFDVVGVDIKPQPNYPFEFRQGDALDMSLWPGRFDAVHASPPCQTWSAYRRRGSGVGADYPDLIARVRDLCQRAGVPYVIENVPRAPLLDPITLCGSMFGLDVRRHRCFESSVPLDVETCDHSVWTERRYPGATNRPNGRFTCEVGVWRIPLDVQRAAMGVDWSVTLRELSEAIPPAYTEHIGRQLIEAL